MADLKAAFESAVAGSKNLTERPDNATLLKLYALYKQATATTTTKRNRASATSWAAPSATPRSAEGRFERRRHAAVHRPDRLAQL